jgi:hypothetical protein
MPLITSRLATVEASSALFRPREGRALNSAARFATAEESVVFKTQRIGEGGFSGTPIIAAVTFRLRAFHERKPLTAKNREEIPQRAGSNSESY